MNRNKYATRMETAGREQGIKLQSSLLILIFLITPVVEEVWLEEQYGEDYMEYKQTTPRFL